MTIKELLSKLNQHLTDTQIGEAIGVSQPTVSRLRSGKLKDTSFEKGKAIERLAKEKGVL